MISPAGRYFNTCVSKLRRSRKRIVRRGAAGWTPNRSRLALEPLSRRRPLELRVGDFRDPVQPVAIRLAAHHIADRAVRPGERRDGSRRVVAQGGVRSVRARAVEREALAGFSLIHEEGGGAVRPRQQSAADKLQPDLFEVGDAQLIADAL